VCQSSRAGDGPNERGAPQPRAAHGSTAHRGSGISDAASDSATFSDDSAVPYAAPNSATFPNDGAVPDTASANTP
jgi:hypothetical protein